MRIGPFLCFMHRLYVSVAIIGMCTLSCTKPEGPCALRWTADAAQLNTSIKIESGELILSTQIVSESVAVRTLCLDTLQIGNYNIAFRDLSTDLTDGRCGIMVYDNHDVPIAGAVLQPGLLLAFVKNTPTDDAVDFRTVEGNAGLFALQVTNDSLYISARVGQIVCSESCNKPTSCKIALFVGAATPLGHGNVSARFSEASFDGTRSWTDSFDCNSVY
jgi:hypothetical protein